MQHTEQVMRWLTPFFDFALLFAKKEQAGGELVGGKSKKKSKGGKGTGERGEMA